MRSANSGRQALSLLLVFTSLFTQTSYETPGIKGKYFPTYNVLYDVFETFRNNMIASPVIRVVFISQMGNLFIAKHATNVYWK